MVDQIHGRGHRPLRSAMLFHRRTPIHSRRMAPTPLCPFSPPYINEVYSHVNREGGAGRKASTHASTHANIDQRPRPCESRLAVSVVHWIAPSPITRSANDGTIVHPSLFPCPIKDEQRTNHGRQRSVKPASVAGALLSHRSHDDMARPHQPATAGSSPSRS